MHNSRSLATRYEKTWIFGFNSSKFSKIFLRRLYFVHQAPADGQSLDNNITDDITTRVHRCSSSAFPSSLRFLLLRLLLCLVGEGTEREVDKCVHYLPIRGTWTRDETRRETLCLLFACDAMQVYVEQPAHDHKTTNNNSNPTWGQKETHTASGVFMNIMKIYLRPSPMWLRWWFRWLAPPHRTVPYVRTNKSSKINSTTGFHRRRTSPSQSQWPER